MRTEQDEDIIAALRLEHAQPSTDVPQSGFFLDEEMITEAVKMVERICTGLDQPGTGLIFFRWMVEVGVTIVVVLGRGCSKVQTESIRAAEPQCE